MAPSSLAEAVPSESSYQTSSSNQTESLAAPSSYWISDIKRQGSVAYGDAAFQIFRNVLDFGAKGRSVSQLQGTRLTRIDPQVTAPLTIPRQSTALSPLEIDVDWAAIRLLSRQRWSISLPGPILSASL